MKYRLLLFVVFILACVVYAKCFHSGPSAAFIALRDAQPNPFRVQRDSADAVWARAKRYLVDNRRSIGAGDLVEKDSTLIIPYATSYEKGSSIRIDRRTVGDSVEFSCHWWYSRDVLKAGAQELALYMQSGIKE